MHLPESHTPRGMLSANISTNSNRQNAKWSEVQNLDRNTWVYSKQYAHNKW